MCVWGDGEQDWGDILRASKSIIAFKVEDRIGARRQFRSRLETVEFIISFWGIHSMLN